MYKIQLLGRRGKESVKGQAGPRSRRVLPGMFFT
jgi:hypothetical protein